MCFAREILRLSPILVMALNTHITGLNLNDRLNVFLGLDQPSILKIC